MGRDTMDVSELLICQTYLKEDFCSQCLSKLFSKNGLFIEGLQLLQVRKIKLYGEESIIKHKRLEDQQFMDFQIRNTLIGPERIV